MPQFNKALFMEAVGLTAALWVLGFIVNQFKIPFLAVPAISGGNVLGLYLGLVAALFVKGYLNKALKIG